MARHSHSISLTPPPPPVTIAPMALYELGIIGAGNMAEAIARGVIRGGAAPARPDHRRRRVAARGGELFSEQLGVTRGRGQRRRRPRTRARCCSASSRSRWPTRWPAVGGAMRPDALVISIAAGISTAFIEQHLGGRRSAGASSARCPTRRCSSARGWSPSPPGANATADDLADGPADLRVGGRRDRGGRGHRSTPSPPLSGSGPAYFFFLVEQMIAAGVRDGPDARAGARSSPTRTAPGRGEDARRVARRRRRSCAARSPAPAARTEAAIRHMDGAAVTGRGERRDLMPPSAGARSLRK